jgi:hypothetical protein
MLTLCRRDICVQRSKTPLAAPASDDVFAEALAKSMRRSRSEVYSRALGEFIGHHDPAHQRRVIAEHFKERKSGDSADDSAELIYLEPGYCASWV